MFIHVLVPVHVLRAEVGMTRDISKHVSNTSLYMNDIGYSYLYEHTNFKGTYINYA